MLHLRLYLNRLNKSIIRHSSTLQFNYTYDALALSGLNLKSSASGKRNRLIELEKKQAVDLNFYRDSSMALELSKIRHSLLNLDEIDNILKDCRFFYDLGNSEKDLSAMKESEEQLDEVNILLKKYRLALVLDEQYDESNAFITILPGNLPSPFSSYGITLFNDESLSLSLSFSRTYTHTHIHTLSLSFSFSHLQDLVEWRHGIGPKC